jgi:hypothetical protein
MAKFVKKKSFADEKGELRRNGENEKVENRN